MEMTLEGITLRAVRIPGTHTVEIFVISESGSQLRVDSYKSPPGGINAEGRDEEKLRLRQLLKRCHSHYRHTAELALERVEADRLQRERNADAWRELGVKVIAA